MSTPENCAGKDYLQCLFLARALSRASILAETCLPDAGTPWIRWGKLWTMTLVAHGLMLHEASPTPFHRSSVL